MKNSFEILNSHYLTCWICQLDGTSSQLLAFCTDNPNTANIFEIESRQDYSNFKGAHINNLKSSIISRIYPVINRYTVYDITRPHVREIPNTSLLVSLNHHHNKSASMEIFDISFKGQARKIYSFEETFGGNKLCEEFFAKGRNLRTNCRRQLYLFRLTIQY